MSNIQSQIPQRVLPSTLPRSHVTFAVHFGPDGREVLLSSARHVNYGDTMFLCLCFSWGNGAQTEHHGGWKTLGHCSILVHKLGKMFPRRDRMHDPHNPLGCDLYLILMISLTTPSLKWKPVCFWILYHHAN